MLFRRDEERVAELEKKVAALEKGLDILSRHAFNRGEPEPKTKAQPKAYAHPASKNGEATGDKKTRTRRPSHRRKLTAEKAGYYYDVDPLELIQMAEEDMLPHAIRDGCIYFSGTEIKDILGKERVR